MRKNQPTHNQPHISEKNIGRYSSMENIKVVWKCNENSHSVATQKASTDNFEPSSAQMKAAAISCVFVVAYLGLCSLTSRMRITSSDSGLEAGYVIGQDNLNAIGTKVKNEETDDVIPTGLYDCVEIAP